MDKDQIAAKIKDLGRWFHYMELNGVPTKDKNIVYVEGLKYPERLYCALQPYLDFVDKDCLDIGCNSGFFSFKLAQKGNRVLGIDLQQSGCKTIDQAYFANSILQTGAHFLNGNFMNLPLKQYDVVMFLGVLYHLKDYEAGLDKVAALVKPGGILFLETAFKGETEFNPEGMAHDKTTYFIPSQEWVFAALMKRGFKVVRRIDYHRLFVQAIKE
jgi:tRNA (mo5U34)-methyltransferase